MEKGDRYSQDEDIFFSELDFNKGEDSRFKSIQKWATDLCYSLGRNDSLREEIKSLLNAAVWKKPGNLQAHGELSFSEKKLVKALLHLTQKDAFAEAISAGWALSLLLKFLTFPKPNIQISSCIALARAANFASEDALKELIPPLIELLDSDSFTRGVSIKEISALTLKRLAKRGEDLRVIIGTSGALPVLLNLASHSDGRMQTLALQALRELVLFTEMNQGLLAQAGGLDAILNLVFSSSATVQCLAAEILGALASLREVRRAIVNQSGIPSLVEAVKIGCNVSKTRAAHALGLLAFTKRLRRMIVDAGGISVLVSLLHDGDLPAKLVAGNTLGIISAHVDHLRPVAQAGAIPLFVNLMEGTDPQGKEIAEDAFCILAVLEENALTIVDNLVRILRSGSVEAKAAAADIVWDLSSYRHSISVITVSGAIPLLVGLLKDENDEVRENVSGAIAQLSYSDYDRQALAEDGVIPILIESLQDRSDEVKENVAEALHNFAEDTCYRSDMSDACAIPALLELQDRVSAGSRVRETSEHAAAALHYLGHTI